MAYLILALCATVIALIYAYLKHNFDYWKNRGVPHEQPALLFGNIKGIGRTVHFRDVNNRIYKRFKGVTPFTGVYFFFNKTAFIIDLDLIKHILIKDFSNFSKRGLFSNVRDDPLTGHLFALDGEEWHAMRNKLSPVFTSGKMKFMFSTIVAVSDNLCAAVEALTKQTEDGSLELKELCSRFTTDVIGTCAFGIECNSLQDPKAEFRERGRVILGEPRHSQLVQAFIITNPTLARHLRFKLFRDDTSEFFLNVVRRTVEYRTKNNITTRHDFMDLLIQLLASDQEAARHLNNIDLAHGLTLEQITAQAFVFFVAGFDTSSTTMSFLLYEMALNPDIQEKLRDEILSVIKSHNGELTYEGMNEMTYLEKVLSETLRKYPVIPHLIRKTGADYPVPNSKHIIQKDTGLIIPIHAIHHDPELYPDPEKFDPSRFEPDAISERHSCAFIPFGDGPRNCIGLRFGKMQAKVGVIALLKNYRFLTCDKTEIPIIMSKKNFILSAENGIYLALERL